MGWLKCTNPMVFNNVFFTALVPLKSVSRDLLYLQCTEVTHCHEIDIKIGTGVIIYKLYIFE